MSGISSFEGGTEVCREVLSLKSRWPISGKTSWDSIKGTLEDPDGLLMEIDTLKGIERDGSYFDFEKRDYLRISYLRKNYLDHLERHLEGLGSADSKRERYMHLDAMRNYALHLLDSWNKHSYKGELGSIERLGEYEGFKDKTYAVCEEFYNLLTHPNYMPKIDQLNSAVDELIGYSETLPKICESKIRQLDNPVELLIHCKRINLVHPHFDTVIGVLDGGIELPMAMRYVQNVAPNIAYLKYSGYSEGGHSKKLERVDEQVSAMELFGLDRKIRGADVAVLDDSIFTGRTFYRMVGALVGQSGRPTNLLPKPRKITVSAVEGISHRLFGAQISQIRDILDVLGSNNVTIVPPTFTRAVRKSDINAYLELIQRQEVGR